MYYIGVDLGTSAVKLILMAEDGSLRNILCFFPKTAGPRKIPPIGGTPW